MKRNRVWIAALGLSLSGLVVGLSAWKNRQPQAALQLELELVSRDLVSPIGLAFTPGDNRTAYVVEQRGYIWRLVEGKRQEPAFLDWRNHLSKVNGQYDERGLLSLVFHPQFAQNGKLYIYYSAPKAEGEKGVNHYGILSELSTDPKNPVQVTGPERVILKVAQPEGNHNGGGLAFGPDGYLYLGLGDGGGQHDQHGAVGNGQDYNALLGSILRLDVNSAQAGLAYGIPQDNPFVGQAGKRPEIWAKGFRNPWRMSFDAQGRLFVGDVGQNLYEEISLVEKGKNYGWRVREGTHCHNPDKNCPTQNLVDPITDYDHGTGVSICGGYLYRGTQHPALKNQYVFADWNGKLFYLSQQGKNWPRQQFITQGASDLVANDIRINSLGEDAQGELYILAQDKVGPLDSPGLLYRIKAVR